MDISETRRPRGHPEGFGNQGGGAGIAQNRAWLPLGSSLLAPWKLAVLESCRSELPELTHLHCRGVSPVKEERASPAHSCAQHQAHRGRPQPEGVVGVRPVDMERFSIQGTRASLVSLF